MYQDLVEGQCKSVTVNCEEEMSFCKICKKACLLHITGSWNSSVNIVTRLWARRFRVQILAEFSLL
jgi:hypothetical protein